MANMMGDMVSDMQENIMFRTWWPTWGVDIVATSTTSMEVVTITKEVSTITK